MKGGIAENCCHCRACFFCMAAANTVATRQLFASQPPWYFLNLNLQKNASYHGCIFWSRALLADIEYINFLQYYGKY
jgi:hypothetical protein